MTRPPVWSFSPQPTRVRRWHRRSGAANEPASATGTTASGQLGTFDIDAGGQRPHRMFGFASTVARWAWPVSSPTASPSASWSAWSAPGSHCGCAMPKGAAGAVHPDGAGGVHKPRLRSGQPLANGLRQVAQTNPVTAAVDVARSLVSGGPLAVPYCTWPSGDRADPPSPASWRYAVGAGPGRAPPRARTGSPATSRTGWSATVSRNGRRSASATASQRLSGGSTAGQRRPPGVRELRR
jgi:hypothetical protein